MPDNDNEEPTYAGCISADHEHVRGAKMCKMELFKKFVANMCGNVSDDVTSYEIFSGGYDAATAPLLDALREAEEAMAYMLALKRHKEIKGADADYVRQKPDAWEGLRICHNKLNALLKGQGDEA